MTALQNAEVTPFVGVWIETCLLHRLWRCQPVTPFVGVWIETLLLLHLSSPFLVTPFVGVWIETRMLSLARPDPESHTLRGCVD